MKVFPLFGRINYARKSSKLWTFLNMSKIFKSDQLRCIQVVVRWCTLSWGPGGWGRVVGHLARWERKWIRDSFYNLTIKKDNICSGNLYGFYVILYNILRNIWVKKVVRFSAYFVVSLICNQFIKPSVLIPMGKCLPKVPHFRMSPTYLPKMTSLVITVKFKLSMG